MQNERKYDIVRKTKRPFRRKGAAIIFERTVAEIAGDYAVLVSESGTRTEVALALLPDGIREGTVLICEDFEYRIKTL